MFTDRKKFLFTYPGARVNKVAWVVRGQQRTAMKSNHALCVNVYAGVTAFGMTKPHLVAGTSKLATEFTNKKGMKAKNITSAEYESVVLNTLLPEGRKIMGSHNITEWVLQQDNDPTHKKASKSALDKWSKLNSGQTVTILPSWPPNSPDLSPIENIWAHVQCQVNKMGCKSFDEFKEKVEYFLAHIPQSMIKNLFRSMKRRLEECIALKGGRTHY